MRWMKWAVVPAMLLAGSVAFGGPGDVDDKKFKEMDTNGDGSLSLQEYVGDKTGDEATTARGEFTKADSNGDGKLTMEECKAAKKPAQPRQPDQPQQQPQ